MIFKTIVKLISNYDLSVNVIRIKQALSGQEEIDKLIEYIEYLLKYLCHK